MALNGQGQSRHNFPHESESIPTVEDFGAPHAQSLIADRLLYRPRMIERNEFHSA